MAGPGYGRQQLLQRLLLSVALLLLLVLLLSATATAATGGSLSSSSSRSRSTTTTSTTTTLSGHATQRPRKALTGARLTLPPTLRGRGGGVKKATVQQRAEKRISICLPILAAYLYNLSIGFTIPVLPKARFDGCACGCVGEGVWAACESVDRV
jgi:hypothetical protein